MFIYDIISTRQFRLVSSHFSIIHLIFRVCFVTVNLNMESRLIFSQNGKKRRIYVIQNRKIIKKAMQMYCNDVKLLEENTQFYCNGKELNGFEIAEQLDVAEINVIVNHKSMFQILF